MMQALHFGAGNIGRGFIGPMLIHSGFDLIFSDINEKIIDAINFFNEYKIEILGKNSHLDKIKNIKAIHLCDSDIISAIKNSDVITTAVGVNVINSLASIISKGIIYKIKSGEKKFLNIMACENSFRCTSELKKNVLFFLPKKYHQYLEDNVGFVDTVVDRIVSSDYKKNENVLFIKVEPFKEFICDINQFRGHIPNIINMQLSDNLNAYSERKLFTVNTGHAIAAYLGVVYGYKNMFDAISDKNIYDVVCGAMYESGNVLVLRHSFDKITHNRYINSILSRFKSSYFSDDLRRIGRNPLRKLQKNDRLIKPILGTLEYKTPNINLIKGVSATLCYTDVNDSEAVELNYLIQNKGIDHILSNISFLDLELSICNLIKKYFWFFKNNLIN